MSMELSILPQVTKEEHSIVHMQVTMCHYLINRWGISPHKFVELDKQYSILHLIREGYYPFHLTGDEGIAEEIESFVIEQGGTWK